MFTHYIQNLEIYNAVIISEPEFTVWSKLEVQKKEQHQTRSPSLTSHTVNSGSEMIKALYISKFWISCVNMLNKLEDTCKKNFVHCPFL